MGGEIQRRTDKQGAAAPASERLSLREREGFLWTMVMAALFISAGGASSTVLWVAFGAWFSLPLVFFFVTGSTPFEAAERLLAARAKEARRLRAQRPPGERRARLSQAARSWRAAVLQNLFDRFHPVAHALGARPRSRDALVISDEYDVQYLMRALLAVDFLDVRPEEHTPSYAGASSRIDFLLKQERVVVEVKMARDGLTDRTIGEQLIVDIARYRVHPDCGELYCFVYDPAHRLTNPTALERDLERHAPGFVRVFVRPKR